MPRERSTDNIAARSSRRPDPRGAIIDIAQQKQIAGHRAERRHPHQPQIQPQRRQSDDQEIRDHQRAAWPIGDRQHAPSAAPDRSAVVTNFIAAGKNCRRKQTSVAKRDHRPGHGQRGHRGVKSIAAHLRQPDRADPSAVVDHLDDVKRGDADNPQQIGPGLAFVLLPAADDEPLAVVRGMPGFGVDASWVPSADEWADAQTASELQNQTAAGGSLAVSRLPSAAPALQHTANPSTTRE